MAKGGKIQMALDHIDKWMPDDFELQKEYYQLINDKDQKGMEEFLDMYADQDRLMRYDIQYEDLGKLSEAIISGSEYAKGGKTSGIKDYLETLESDQIFDLCNDFYYDDEEWHEIKNDLDKDDLIQWAYDYCKKNKISLKDLKDVLGDREDEIADMKKMLQSNLIPYLDIAGKNPGVINLRVYNKDSFAFYNKNDNCKVAINYNYDSKSVIMYQEWDDGNMDDDEVTLSTFENYLSNTKMADGGEIKVKDQYKLIDTRFDPFITSGRARVRLDKDDVVKITSLKAKDEPDSVVAQSYMYKVVIPKEDLKNKFKKIMSYDSSGIDGENNTDDSNKINDMKHIAYIEDSRRPGGSDKSIKKTYNLDVEDRSSDGFYVAGSKEDIEDFINDYGINFAEIKEYMAKGGKVYKYVVKKKIFDINDDEISEDIFEWAIENVPEEFEFEEDEEELFRNSNWEDVIDEINSRLEDYELLVDYEEDRIYVNIYKKDNMAKGGKLPNPSNLYGLMIKDRETGYGTIADGKVYTINEALAKADKLDESNDLNNGLDTFVDILSVEELLKRPTLPKSSKKIIYDNYKEKVKLMNYLIERFGTDSTDWQKDFAKGGATSKYNVGDTVVYYNREGKITKISKTKGVYVEYLDGGFDDDDPGGEWLDQDDEDLYTLGDVEDLDAEMEKLVDEHTKEAKKNRVKITNLGWSQGDDFIVSKTTERKDGSDVLTSEISNGVVTHDWDSYKRGGKLKTNPAKFRDKVNAITKKLAGTKVPKKYKKDYGATYDKKEANTAAKRIAGAKLAEVRAKLAKKKK